jgi:hypothetical protein
MFTSITSSHLSSSFVVVVLLSSDTEYSNAGAVAHTAAVLHKRQSIATVDSSQASGGPNQRRQKDHQPNWSAPKILALIKTKEAEHEAFKLCGDSRDLMQTATQKWEKVATDVSKARISVHKQGASTCKDKWQTLLADFKKISDYNAATRSAEDYFHMSGKRRKELTLPSNFCSAQYREMAKFLSQRPCLNPPRQWKTFSMEEEDIQSTEDLVRYCAIHQVTEEMLTGGDGFPDPDIVRDLPPPGIGGSHGPRLPRPIAPSGIHTRKGEEKLENATHNMAANPRPTNTAVRRKYNSSHTNLLEVTETHGKEIVSNMQKMSDMEERKVLATREIAEKQL